MVTKKDTTKSVKKGLAIGGAVVAGLGAIAGAYFLYGTKAGEQKRKAVKGWMLKAKGEALEKIEAIKDITEEKYLSVIDSVMGKYDKLQDKYGDDVNLLKKELKSYWKVMQQKTKPASSKKIATKKTTPKK
jgi:hypothetical protein